MFGGVHRKVEALAPDPVGDVLSTLYRWFDRVRLRGRVWHRHERNHDAPLEPLTPRWVDPHSIDRRISNPTSLIDAVNTPGAVLGGDWDRNQVPVETHPYHRFFTSHFVDGVPWEETSFFRRKARFLESDGEETNDRKSTWHHSRTVEDLHERCQQVDSLYEAIDEYGYMTQRELREYDSVPLGAPRSSEIPERNEVTVAIDREGEFLFVDGGHRFFVARILDVERIPVHVLVRHSEWQRVRDRIYDETVISERYPKSAEYLDHPDVRDVAPVPENAE